MSELIPGYYLWRDRIPFFVTLIYFTYRAYPCPTLEKQLEKASKWFLVLINTLTLWAVYVWVRDKNLSSIVGFKWSIASPFTWGVFIMVCYGLMRRNENSVIDSFYYSFIAGVGGGWIYDINWWIRGSLENILQVNYYKVFFINFQIICVVVLILLVLYDKTYRDNKYSFWLLVFSFLFYLNTPILRPFFNYSLTPIKLSLYGFVIRLPIQLYLINVFKEIKPKVMKRE